jgi:lambda repressor-like predicted transcriptional regulator
MTGAEPVDWFRLIADLKRAGVSGRKLALKLGVSHSTVNYWRSGGTPRYANGVALVGLHSKMDENSSTKGFINSIGHYL